MSDGLRQMLQRITFKFSTKLNDFLICGMYGNTPHTISNTIALKLSKMSLVCSSICLFKSGIPVDIVNAVVEYIGTTPNARWIPRFNICGNLQWTLNKQAFNGLSDICSVKPTIYNGFRRTPTVMVINGVEQEHPCSSVLLIAPKLITPDIIHTTVYATIEIAPNVFNHISVVCEWGVGAFGDITNFYKGSLYRPYEHKWNREQPVTSIQIDNNRITVVHNEVIIQNVWNTELNIWEYVVYDNQPFNHEQIWDHDDTETDDIGWA